MIKKIITVFLVCVVMTFSKENHLTYSYGIHDFILENSHTLGINVDIDYSSMIMLDTFQEISFSAYIEHDPAEHDPDHIPVWFQGGYHLNKTIYAINKNINLKSSVDILWKMNTVFGVEQNLRSSIELGLEYRLNQIVTTINLGGGTYYMEFDDDVPRIRGFSRNELSRGFVPALMYGLDFKYRYNKNIDYILTYRKWNESNTMLEEDISFTFKYKKDDDFSIFLKLDKSQYGLDKYQKNNVYILPWNSDILLKLTIEKPF